MKQVISYAEWLRRESARQGLKVEQFYHMVKTGVFPEPRTSKVNKKHMIVHFPLPRYDRYTFTPMKEWFSREADALGIKVSALQHRITRGKHQGPPNPVRGASGRARWIKTKIVEMRHD